ncbi:hypothetical protein BLD44_017240 [Mastigocladus laminosus UU774]|nr:hypothetical protein BLD44_017240 [Mastigocladus laminosus UU774]
MEPTIYAVVKVEADASLDCTLAGRYWYDIVPLEAANNDYVVFSGHIDHCGEVKQKLESEFQEEIY